MPCRDGNATPRASANTSRREIALRKHVLAKLQHALCTLCLKGPTSSTFGLTRILKSANNLYCLPIATTDSPTHSLHHPNLLPPLTGYCGPITSKSLVSDALLPRSSLSAAREKTDVPSRQSVVDHPQGHRLSSCAFGERALSATLRIDLNYVEAKRT